MRTLLLSGFCLAALLTAMPGAETKKESDRARLEEMTRLQIFLDRANFGPGKIDGKGGEFTRKALKRYREAQGTPTQAGAEASMRSEQKKKDSEGEQINTSGLDLQSVGEPFISYTVTKEDLEGLGEVPKAPAAQAKLKFLPYQTAWERISEKFHADPDFLKELNPGVKPESLKEGDQLTVPNVEPFELATVKDLKPGEALKKDEPGAADTEATAGRQKEKEDSKKGDSADEKPSEKVAIHINTGENMLEVRQSDRLIAAFPVTPGSDDIPTPVGEWKIKGVATMPDFRYDKKMLQEGQRGEESHLIPPGPNSPVGVIWIALNKPGIGIHGTDDPETIGRAASHGCIRLANWDAVKLARLVKGGVPVTIK